MKPRLVTSRNDERKQLRQLRKQRKQSGLDQFKRLGLKTGNKQTTERA